MADTAGKSAKAVFSMRIPSDKKSSLEFLYSGLGMTLAEAVNIFFEKSLAVGGIPFDVRLPEYSRETLEAMREAMDIEAGRVPAKRYRTAEELFADNDAEIAGEREHA
ncbi:MAG: type II toxin-antitoxin system RelB/DinJ family antitoxin [Oscillibacter sp.]|nr:type II toxin-antitoxin system RelB/DinJ family antitoxin [Oscillibacter sp.]